MKREIVLATIPIFSGICLAFSIVFINQANYRMKQAIEYERLSFKHQCKETVYYQYKDCPEDRRMIITKTVKYMP